VLGAIRGRIPGVKLIVVTESTADPLAQSCLKAGAQSLLAKPLTIENVRRKVDIALGRRTTLAIPVQLG
jgi:CheY-like chemotaxis protein